MPPGRPETFVALLAFGRGRSADVAGTLASLQPRDARVVLVTTDDGLRATSAGRVDDISVLAADQSYTALCRFALDLASERGAALALILDAGIALPIETLERLIGEAACDPRLAVIGPTTQAEGSRPTYRRVWQDGTLADDTTPPADDAGRLEADAVDLRCALFNMAVYRTIAPLRDAFSPDRASADFAIRARSAGFSCAAAVTEPIRLPDRRAGGEAGVRAPGLLLHPLWMASPRPGDATSWGVVKRNLQGELSRFGLIDGRAPWLTFAHPGLRPFDHLYTVWETDRLPQRWLAYRRSYRAVFAASRWNTDIFREAGFADVHHVPLGVNLDRYRPAPASEARPDFTYLWFAHRQHRKGLDVIWSAWRRFRSEGGRGRLVIMGHGVVRGHEQAVRGRSGKFLEAELPDIGVLIREIIEPLDDHEVAAIYRSSDAVVVTSRSEGFGFIVAEAMACGTLVIGPNYGAAGEFFDGASLTFGGDPVRADYSDLGFGDVGRWWEPRIEEVVARLHEAKALGAAERRQAIRAGLSLIRGSYSWRNTVVALQTALSASTDRAPAPRRPRRDDLPPPKNPSHLPARLAWYAGHNRLTYAGRSFVDERKAVGLRGATAKLASRLWTFVSRRLRR